MTERWWAPSRATIEPDAVVLALLQPDGQAVGDFGATLLAVHRAGAAAVETVSKSAVPSEVGLVRTMAAAREHVAIRVVDAAASSLSDPGYAALMVRDFFDDAEEGALTLYRAAISKGVSRPIAMERVGAVYGVPYRHLGGYAVMATDPKANPAALADAADQVLLKYVSKTVDAEVKEPVSKAPQTLLESRWDEKMHDRGEGGRFTDMSTSRLDDPALMARMRSVMGVGGQAAPRVADEPATLPVTKPRRIGKLVRLNRIKTVPKTEAPDAQAAETKPAMKPSQMAASRMASVQMTAKKMAEHKMAEKLNAGSVPLNPFTLSGSRPPNEFPEDVMKPIKSDYFGTFKELTDYQRAFFLTGEEAFEFTGAMGGPKNERIFRMGYLNKSTGNGNGDKMFSHEAEKTADQTADLAKEEADIDLSRPTFPAITEIDPREMADARRIGMPEHVFLTGKREEQIRESVKLPSGETIERTIAAEEPHVYTVKDYADKSTWLTVHITADPAHPLAGRPLVAITEFYATSLYGVKEGGGTIHGAERITVDPNQVYQVGAPEQYYDRDKHVFVNRFKVAPISESDAAELQRKKGFGTAHKSLDTMERTSFNQQHPRAMGGKFTDKMEQRSSVAPTAVNEVAQPNQRVTDMIRAALAAKAPAPLARGRTKIQRIQRIKRISRPAPAQHSSFSTQVALPMTLSRMQTSTMAERSMAMKAMVASEVRAASTASAAASGKKRLILDDSQEYRLFTMNSFNNLVRRHGTTPSAGVDPMAGTKLSNAGHEKLMFVDPLSDVQAMGSIRKTIANMATDVGMEDLGNPIPFRPGNLEDATTVAHTISKWFERRPELSYVALREEIIDDVDVMENAAAFKDFVPSMTYQLMGNAAPIDPIIIVEMDKNVSWERQHIDLVRIDKYTSQDVVSENYVPPHPGNALTEQDMDNGPVHYYRAEVHKHRFLG